YPLYCFHEKLQEPPMQCHRLMALEPSHPTPIKRGNLKAIALTHSPSQASECAALFQRGKLFGGWEGITVNC
ncbi:MAG: hypothetical protein ACYTXI_03095, partial [Nostoc sp.]